MHTSDSHLRSPRPQGLYHPRNEHDACGMGLVASIRGEKSHDIIRKGLEVLINLTHRGAAMARGDYTPTFELTMARKDARLMIESAGTRPLAVLPAVAQRMDVLIGRGFGADDVGVLAVDAVPKAAKG